MGLGSRCDENQMKLKQCLFVFWGFFAKKDKSFIPVAIEGFILMEQDQMNGVVSFLP